MTEPAKDPTAAGSGRYATVAIVLHWLIAAAILFQIVLSSRMGAPRTPTSFAVSQFHKSIGISILLLSLVRLGWRLAHPPAPLPATMTPWERELARVVHVGFYVIMIAMPLTGWIMVSAGRTATPFLLFGQIPWFNLPLQHLAAPVKAVWHDIGENGHGILAKVIYVLLVLHVAGALKHQLFSRDEPVLARMAPGAVAGRWLEPRIVVILLGVGAVLAVAKFMPPPDPGVHPPPAAARPQGLSR
jgi:cytochrome b561